MRYLDHSTLPDGEHLRLLVSDVDPVEIGAAYERTLVPISDGHIATIRRGTGYTAMGALSRKAGWFDVFDEGVLVAVLAVALHSRPGPKLWERAHAAACLELTGVPRQAPWSVLVHMAPRIVRAPWLEQWARSVAISMLVHAEP